jgi:4-amino-4-deoxy-L-arabinose transferase-like glycosyltransferase
VTDDAAPHDATKGSPDVATPYTLRDVAVPLAVGLALRLVWILLCPNEPTSDQFIYHDSARGLVEHLAYVDESGNPAGYWPVGYAALLAPFYAVFGAKPTVAFLVNALLGGLTIVTTWGLASELFGRAAGRAAALVVACLPTLVLYTTCIASENAVLPGLTGAVWLMMRRDPTGAAFAWRSRNRIVLDVLAGVVLALTTYVRGTALPFALLPLIFIRQLAYGAFVRTAVVATAMVALTIPWGIRNHHLFGSAAITSINAGANLWMGNHEGTDGMAADLPTDLPDGLAERDREAKLRAVRFIAQDPVRYVRLAVKRTWVTLRSDTIAATWNQLGLTARFGEKSVAVAKGICTAGYFALILAAALGLWVRRQKLGMGDLVIAIACGLVAIPFVLIVGGNRYHMPLQPFLATWAGVGLLSVLAGWKRLRSTPRA